jgi:hypothetical protein
MIRIVAAERAPRVLDPVRSLAAARDLELPLAVAMLTPAAPRPAQKPATVVVSQAARAALTTRLLRDHGFPFDTRAGIPVRDHRQFPPLELPERPARTVPVRVSITSSGTSLDGISVEVVSPDSVTHRPDLVGDQHSVSGSVEVPAAPAGKAAVVVVRVVDRDRPLDQQTLAVGAAPVDVRWSVAAEPIRIVLTAEKVPTLFGHVVEPVPRCPDPDEELSWE